MKCEFCGTENTADAKFCMQCGKEILTEESLEEKADDSSALIYCKECGAENSIDSDFCYACGAKLQKDETDSGNSDEEVVKWVTPETEETIKWFMLGADALSKGGLDKEPEERNDVICPFCGAPNCDVTQKTNATVASKFGFGSGCCGMLLFGWPGLLCGLCGSKTKTNLASETWWACKSCGKLHLSTNDAIKRWEESLLAMWGNVISSGISYAIVMWIFGLIGFVDFGSGLFSFSLSGLFSLMVFGMGACLPFEQIHEIHKDIEKEFGASIIRFLTPDQKRESLLTLILIVIATMASELISLSILTYLLSE